MTINEMEIDKVLWCNSCGTVTIVINDATCPQCNQPMTEIGFVEDKLQSKRQNTSGGSVKTGFCKCGNQRAKKGTDLYGRTRYRTQCYKCLYAGRKIAKADSCKFCGIKPEDKKQLHKDHIDGDRSNNDAKNIQTLCVDCHKYKTNKQQDWKKKDGI